ncbi:hypothetical protein J1N35_040760 [Gossypium stocksii]|uniref:Uncharacterized protein n=1 Tax=Gossypium stocksii TaxID=47602 RepID=A0A9D3UE74_9ROSI|nr:hypothetical protein J1N35_040760 [Gossypium stocksii]
MAVVPSENELIALAPNIKRRRMSVVRDFSPRCGRVAAPNSGSSKQIMVDRSSQGKW